MNIRKTDPAAFAKTWTLAGSSKEVAEKLGKTVMWVNAYAARLRKQGVKLKSFLGPKLDVEALNKLIKETV